MRHSKTHFLTFQTPLGYRNNKINTLSWLLLPKSLLYILILLYMMSAATYLYKNMNNGVTCFGLWSVVYVMNIKVGIIKLPIGGNSPCNQYSIKHSVRQSSRFKFQWAINLKFNLKTIVWCSSKDAYLRNVWMWNSYILVITDLVQTDFSTNRLYR